MNEAIYKSLPVVFTGTVTETEEINLDGLEVEP